MEAYPAEYYEHNLPLVLLSGLGTGEKNATEQQKSFRLEAGVRVSSSSPECQGEQAQALLRQLLAHDGSKLPWNSSSLPGPSGVFKYKMRAIGRDYSLPPRKAAPLAQSPSGEGFELHNTNPNRNSELHSPLSPLSPGSPICPDGVFTPLWMKKHQQQVPALFISFFQMRSDNDGNDDDMIKNDINSIRSALNRSGFKSKFAVVLLSEPSIVRSPELEDRLSSIRRATLLDSKGGFFSMPPMTSKPEIDTFIQSMLTPLQPMCVEYYRDLTKHARRKKTRGGPPPSSTSQIGVGAQILSTSGWYLRYEVKQGVFAEFRQEMDVAERHYSAAIEELFNVEGVLEFTPSWSPRWEEARLLGDCLALRVVRCQLWAGSTTGAVQSWNAYRARMRDIVNRRGKGSKTHSWNAWETRWAEVMAQLVQRAQIPALHVTSSQTQDPSDLSLNRVFVAPEKPHTSTDRHPPFNSLHHAGYWHRRSAISSRLRRDRASDIPDEDRTPPGQSPASTVAKRHASYDTYLVPDPHEEHPLPGSEGYDHMADIMGHANSAVLRFTESGQRRMAECLGLEIARDLVNAERYSEATAIVVALWETSTWRNETWLDIFAELLKLVHLCGTKESNAEALLGVTYELLSVPANLAKSQSLDLAHCLDGIQSPVEGPIHLHFENNERLSPISTSFAFESKDGYVGEPMSAQIVMSSKAIPDSAPITLSRVTFTISPSRAITINHASDLSASANEVDFMQLNSASDSSESSLEASADLTFRPGQQRIFGVQLKFRESSSVRLEGMSLLIETEKFKVEHKFNDETQLAAESLFSSRDGILHRTRLSQQESTVVAILPKPPKVQIQPRVLRKRYYTDELIHLEIDIANGEIEPITGTVKARVEEGPDTLPRLQWPSQKEGRDTASFDHHADTTITDVPASSSHKLTLLVESPKDSASASITIDVDYTLRSDSSAHLVKTLTIPLEIAKPFEAKFNFGPLLYADAWPSLFEADRVGDKSKAHGTPQIWRLSSQARSLANENLFVNGMELALDRVVGDAEATAREQDPFEKETLRPGNLVRSSFELHTQKFSLDDRRATSVESTLIINWSREEDSERVVTKIAVPQLTLPVSEPRVLCKLDETTPAEADVVVRYHVENPSAHFLTFSLTMEASEEFAFSGPKYRALSLAPLSRHHVEYRIALYDQQVYPTTKEEGGRWISPALQVIDSFYNKQLRIHAGGPGVRTDEKGVVSVWIEVP